MKPMALLVAAPFVLTVGACDSIYESSRFNLASEQMAQITQSDIVNRGEFTINMPQFLARQARDLQEQIDKSGYVPKPSITPGICSPRAVANAFSAQGNLESGVLQSPAFVQDKVIRAMLETAKITDPANFSLATLDNYGQENNLSYADFVNFLRLITDAKNATVAGVSLNGVAPRPTAGRLITYDVEQEDGHNS